MNRQIKALKNKIDKELNTFMSLLNELPAKHKSAVEVFKCNVFDDSTINLFKPSNDGDKEIFNAAITIRNLLVSVNTWKTDEEEHRLYMSDCYGYIGDIIDNVRVLMESALRYGVDDFTPPSSLGGYSYNNRTLEEYFAYELEEISYQLVKIKNILTPKSSFAFDLGVVAPLNEELIEGIFSTLYEVLDCPQKLNALPQLHETTLEIMHYIENDEKLQLSIYSDIHDSINTLLIGIDNIGVLLLKYSKAIRKYTNTMEPE